MSKLYIIHGWAYSTDRWQATLKGLKRAGVDPVMLNVPGLTAPSDKPWTMASYVDWLHDQLQGVKDPIVLGHSNGGRIALNYSVKHPGKIKHLVLLNSAGVRSDLQSVGRKRKVVAALAKVFKPLKHVPVVRKVVYRLLGATDYDNAPPNMKITLRNMLESDKLLDASKVKTPTSLIWGERDTQTPISQARELQKVLPNVTSLDVIKEARHAPYFTHPDLTVEAILKVLEQAR